MQSKILNQRYELAEKIGDGGMATVYRGRDVRLNRVVAIKILHPHHATDLNFLQRFSHEAQAAANLRHPSIVDIYDVGQEERQHFIVMEFVDGSDLKSMILRYKQLPVQQVLQITSAIADGLDAAHQLGMVHRDVKPQNIMVAHDGTAKITDFGIAKSGLSTAQTETGVTFGTADYISPEQARGQPATAQSDIYALAVTIYEALTGQLPFTGDSAVAVALQHVGSKPPPIRRHNPGVSTALEQLIMRALAKNPSERPATAKEFGQLLRAQEETEVRDTAPRPVRTNGNNSRSVTSISAGMRNLPPKRSTITSPLPSRAGREFGGFLILLLLLTLALGLFYLFAIGSFNGLISPNTNRNTAPNATQAIIATPTAIIAFSSSSVPDLRNLNENDVVTTLVNAGLTPVADPAKYSNDVPKGLIMSQNPTAGDPAPADKTVHYILSLGKLAPHVPAQVVGLNANEVRQQLEVMNLRVILIEEYNTTVPNNNVIRTDPAPDSLLQAGDTVRVYASLGANRRVPNIVNIPEVDALKLLQSAGITTTNVIYQGCDNLGTLCDTVAAGQVARTEPAIGSLIADGTTIVITIRQP
jgi:serine/threonine protein kinase